MLTELKAHRVANGVVDLRALQEVATEFPLAEGILVAIRRSCQEVPSALPLWRLLFVGFQSGKGHLWWCMQFMVIGARAFDNFMPASGLPPNPAIAGVRVAKRRRRDPAMEEALLEQNSGKSLGAIQAVGRTHGLRGTWVAKAVRLQLLKYYIASRKHFSLCKN